MKLELFEYRLPDYLACYLINGDSDGLTDKEIEEIQNFLIAENITILEKKDDSNFYYRNDLNNMGADCSTYIATTLKTV